MRLWTLHPKYLDARGLVALWREGLLAQAVLRGRTRGYTQHPQLARFREARAPLAAIAAYLREVRAEAERRGYRFDARKIAGHSGSVRLPATTGQLAYEWRHLTAKLRRRDPSRLRELRGVDRPLAHPLFRVVRGGVQDWERVLPRDVRSQPLARASGPRRRPAGRLSASTTDRASR